MNHDDQRIGAAPKLTLQSLDLRLARLEGIIRVCEPGYADGAAEYRVSARPKGKGKTPV